MAVCTPPSSGVGGLRGGHQQRGDGEVINLIGADSGFFFLHWFESKIQSDRSCESKQEARIQANGATAGCRPCRRRRFDLVRLRASLASSNVFLTG